jgi:hypothetical protein
MLFSKIKIGDQEIKLKPLMVGENASMTDYKNPNAEILILKCTDEGGELWVSKKGISIEFGQIRAVESEQLELENKFTDEYSRRITTKFGEADLILKFSTL